MLGSFTLCPAFALARSPWEPSTVALQIPIPERSLNLDGLGIDDTAPLVALVKTLIQFVDLQLVHIVWDGRSINFF